MKPCFRLCFLLALWLLAQQAQAQAEFRPGYVLPLAGDTLRGLVAQLGTQRSFRQCRFRSTATADPVSYTPLQLKGYGTQGGPHYRTHRVTVQDTLREWQFLEVLASGPAALLTSSDVNNDPHFYLERGVAPLIELRLIRRRVTEAGREYEVEINQYQQTLLVAFADCPQLAGRIRQTRFGVQALADLFRRYNSCLNPAQAPGAAPAKARVRLGLLAGLTLADRLHMSSATMPGYYNLDLPAATVPVGGLQLGLNYPRLSRRLWLNLGVLYHHRSYAAAAAANRVVTSSADKSYDLNYQADYLRLPATLRFEVGRALFRPLVELGVEWDFRLSESRNELAIHYSNGTPDRTKVLFEGLQGYQQGVVVGVGVGTHRATGHNATLMGRYVFSSSAIPYTSVDSNSRLFIILLGYDLFGN